jgi:large conductance mechanosensitive channel
MIKKLFGEYRDFINQGNVVTVAVGLVMALYFKSIVDAFINGIIMPIVSAIVGEENFDDVDIGIGSATLEIGLVIQAIIMFLVVALVLFLIIRAYNTYIAKPQDEVGTDTELSLLTEIRDELRSGSR